MIIGSRTPPVQAKFEYRVRRAIGMQKNNEGCPTPLRQRPTDFIAALKCRCNAKGAG